MRAVKGRKLDGEEGGGILTSTNNFFQSPAPNLPAWLPSALDFHGPFLFVRGEKCSGLVLYCDVCFGFFSCST